MHQRTGGGLAAGNDLDAAPRRHGSAGDLTYLAQRDARADSGEPRAPSGASSEATARHAASPAGERTGRVVVMLEFRHPFGDKQGHDMWAYGSLKQLELCQTN
jgi:hypothetical protein